MGSQHQNIVVVIRHTHGVVEVPLREWIERGPPEGRPLLSPEAARDAVTGEAVPLSVIPFGLRNTPVERLLVRLRILPKPWEKARIQDSEPPSDEGT